MLGEMGFDVDAFEPRGIERAPNLWSFFFGDLQAMFTRQFIAGREGDTHWTGTEFLELANQRPLPTAKDILDNLAARDHMRASLLAQMHDWPVLLLPVCGVEAFAHRQRRFETDGKPIGLFEAMMPVTPFNLLGMPGMVIPFDVAESGLPIGIQLVARPWEEALLLALAARMEEVRGEFQLPESRARAGVVS
jgi:Asp-tRNA(Asn)/Glu-tRNA(Gln) amidotransferase A subunit family amidase